MDSINKFDFVNYAKKNIPFIISLIIIIILIIFYYNFKCNTENLMLEGMWKGSEDFCKKAQITGMLFYIGPVLQGLFTYSRKAYIIVHKDNDIVVQHKFTMQFYNSPLNILPYTLTKYVKIYDNDEDNSNNINDVLPESLIMKLDVGDGHLILSTNEDEPTVYADLYKDAEATSSV